MFNDQGFLSLYCMGNTFSFLFLPLSLPLLPSSLPPSRLSSFSSFLSFPSETGPPISQVGLELNLWLRITLNFWLSCLYNPRAGISNKNYHPSPEAIVIFWSVLPPRATSGSVVLLQLGSMLMSVAHATNEGHMDVRDLCHSLKPC